MENGEIAECMRTLTTRELALLCSYARSAVLTSGRFDTRDKLFHSSPSSLSLCISLSLSLSPRARSRSRRRSSPSASSRRSSSISDGDGSDGESGDGRGEAHFEEGGFGKGGKDYMH